MQPIHRRAGRHVFSRTAGPPKERFHLGELLPEFPVIHHREPPIGNEAQAMARISGGSVHASCRGNAPEGYHTVWRNVLSSRELTMKVQSLSTTPCMSAHMALSSKCDTSGRGMRLPSASTTVTSE